MTICVIRNWDQFQHYKDRNPPWIKLHFSLLASADWVVLDDTARVLAIACMLIASRSAGKLDCSEAGLSYLRRVAYLNVAPDIKPLIECGFLVVEKDRRKPALADASASVITETEERRDREETDVAPSSGAALTSSESKPLTPLQLIVRAWKIQTGVEPDDEAWDKAHFKRHCRPAQSLLNLFGGDVDAAVDCIEDVYQRLVTEKNLDLSLQGVVNNSGRFRQEWSERKEKRRSA